MKRNVLLSLGTLLLAFLAACAGSQKVFRITTDPAGAEIYVDGDPKGVSGGTTSEETGGTDKVLIRFPAGKQVPVWAKKEKYLPAGIMVGPHSSTEIAFFLEPDHSQEIVQGLRNLSLQLERLSESLRRLRTAVEERKTAEDKK